MTTTISRMYPTQEQAAKAAAALAEEGLPDIHMVSGEECAGLSQDEIVDRITKGYVLKYNARILAEGVAKGNSLVTIHALFGLAELATQIMDSFGPIDSGLPEQQSPKPMEWDDATPLSCLLQMPVLMKSSTPFSNFWGRLPALVSHSFALSPKFGFSMLAKEATPCSKVIGAPVLLDDPAPLSRRLGMKLLSDRPAPLSSMMHMPTSK